MFLKNYILGLVNTPRPPILHSEKLTVLHYRAAQLKVLSAVFILGLVVNVVLVAVVDSASVTLHNRYSMQLIPKRNGSILSEQNISVQLHKEKAGGVIQLPVSRNELEKFGLQNTTPLAEPLISVNAQQFTLSNSIQQWATLNHWVLHWQLPVDFSISTKTHSELDRREPLQKMVQYIPPYLLKRGLFFAGYTANRVLVINSAPSSKLWKELQTQRIPAVHLEHRDSGFLDALLMFGAILTLILYRIIEHNELAYGANMDKICSDVIE